MRLSTMLTRVLGSTGLATQAGRQLLAPQVKMAITPPSQEPPSWSSRRVALLGLTGWILSPLAATSATAGNTDQKLQGPSNKRIGGLVSKIRGISNVMVSRLSLRGSSNIFGFSSLQCSRMNYNEI